MLRLGPPVRPYSTVLVYAPMGGIAIALPIPSALVRTQLRIGGGYAVYRFDQGVVSPWIRDPAALVALGLMAGGADRVGYMAEVRCVISSFDATRLPLRVPSAQRTTQQDWTAVVGLRFRL
jgi:hypothetical protein